MFEVLRCLLFHRTFDYIFRAVPQFEGEEEGDVTNRIEVFKCRSCGRLKEKRYGVCELRQYKGEGIKLYWMGLEQQGDDLIVTGGEIEVSCDENDVPLKDEEKTEKYAEKLAEGLCKGVFAWFKSDLSDKKRGKHHGQV